MELLQMIISFITLGIIPLVVKRMESNHKKRASEDLEIILAIKRLTILNLIQHDPLNTVAITEEYGEYEGLGGNHYIKEIYEQWKRKYLNKNGG